MFDNGSKVTLVTNHFTDKNKLPFKKAPFTLSVIGTKPTNMSFSPKSLLTLKEEAVNSLNLKEGSKNITLWFQQDNCHWSQ